MGILKVERGGMIKFMDEEEMDEGVTYSIQKEGGLFFDLCCDGSLILY